MNTFFPEVKGQVGLGDNIKGGLGNCPLSASWSRDNAISSGGRDETHQHRTTMVCQLAWNTVGLVNLVLSVASSHRMMAPRIAVATSLGHLTPRPQ